MTASNHLNKQQLSKIIDQLAEKHVSNQPANFAEPPWHLLQAHVPENEMSGWMYMGEEPYGNPQYHSPEVPRTHHIFKHGISRESVGIGVGNQGPVVTRNNFKNHYDVLNYLGESPQQAYNDEYIVKRSQALKNAGWDSIIGKAE